jgi:hypothetical protein
MFSNNSKVASFYPVNKRSNTNFNNFITNPTANSFSTNYNNLAFGDGQCLNYQDNSISDSVELALITVNLSHNRFKSMNREELDSYIKSIAYNNSFESKKFLLALNILTAEIDKTYNNIIKQQPVINKNKNQNNNQYLKSDYDFQEKKINMNEVICIEPDEFNLNTNLHSSDNFTSYTNSSMSQGFSPNINPTDPYNKNINKNVPFKQNKNLEMSTFSGNPMGTFKITNNQPMNSLRPINPIRKNILDNTSNYDNVSQQTNTTSQFYFEDNSSYGSFDTKSNFHDTIGNKNIIQQTTPLSNPLMFQGNGGRKRTSNMDASTVSFS